MPLEAPVVRSERVPKQWDERVAIAIMVGAWLLMGAIGFGLEIWELKLWLMYVM
jgi:hypothetical protein